MYDISQVCLFTTNGNFSSALLQIDRARWTLESFSRWHFVVRAGITVVVVGVIPFVTVVVVVVVCFC